MENAAHTQCIQISSQTLLIGAPDGRSWLLPIGGTNLTPLPVSAVAAKHLSIAASLIEGAIYAGLSQSGHASAATAYTLLRYVRWLVGNYIFAAQTPDLFRRGADRLEAAGRHDLAQFARQKAREETGHAQLAYRDLEGLGLPAAKVVEIIQPPSASVFAERFRSYVESRDPIALFGFSYCLERMAVERDEAFFQRARDLCPAEAEAHRFLKVHSTIGSDSRHVHEQLEVFDSFSNAELTHVVCAAYETAAMLAQQPLMDQALSDQEIDRRFRLAAIEVPRSAATPCD
jgi:hypothetical protein